MPKEISKRKYQLKLQKISIRYLQEIPIEKDAN
jgi:hypothetical protein